MPGYWTRWTKTTAGMSSEEIERVALNNRLIIDKRPYFMRHLYPRLNKKYNRYNRKYHNHCATMFGRSLDSVLYDYHNVPSQLSEDERQTAEQYYRFSPIIEADCIANKACRFLESEVKEIKKKVKNSSIEHIVGILTDASIACDDSKYQAIKALHKKYKSGKSNFAFIKDVNGKEMFSNLEQYNKFILEEAQGISADISELANLAVRVCYIECPHDTKQFVWQIFGEGIIGSVMKHRQENPTAPFLDASGDIEYLGSYFKLYPISTDIGSKEGEVSYASYL
jgi:hypothetical protein